MTNVTRFREVVRGQSDFEHLKKRMDAGWQLHAVEWERTDGQNSSSDAWIEEVPYGLRVAEDCAHLVQNPIEMQALTLMMELLVQDYPLSKVADDANRRGYRTRQGAEWSSVDVFNLLPRLVEVGPRIFSSEEWIERRQHFLRFI